MFEHLKKKVHFGHVELEERILDRSEDGKTDIEHEPRATCEDVIPDSNAKLDWKTVEKA